MKGDMLSQHVDQPDQDLLTVSPGGVFAAQFSFGVRLLLGGLHFFVGP